MCHIVTLQNIHETRKVLHQDELNMKLHWLPKLIPKSHFLRGDNHDHDHRRLLFLISLGSAGNPHHHSYILCYNTTTTSYGKWERYRHAYHYYIDFGGKVSESNKCAFCVFSWKSKHAFYMQFYHYVVSHVELDTVIHLHFLMDFLFLSLFYKHR